MTGRRSPDFLPGNLVPAALAAFLLLIVGCGGGGSSSSGAPAGSTGSSGGSSSGGSVTTTTPPAPDPTCSSTSGGSGIQNQSQAAVGGGETSVAIPLSSLRRPAGSGRAHTNHLVYTGARTLSAGGQGFSPADLRLAYGVPTDTNGGAIAIVDAYHYPTALADFNVYSSNYNLPQEGSSDPLSSANAVLQVVYSSGTKPSVDSGWAQEMALDIQMAHALAPSAKIYLVECPSENFTDLMQGVKTAAGLPGVQAISISWGGAEDGCLYALYDSYFAVGGVTTFVAAGDSSGVRDFPALSKNVVCVGGTSLSVNPDGTWASEQAWSSSGGQVSLYEPRPSFQDAIVSAVGAYRSGCDIAAVADPKTGVSVYDSTPSSGMSGWMIFGGTSASAPIIAGISHAAGGRSSSQALNSHIYSLIGTKSFHAIAALSGAVSSSAGWDVPTGVGTPNGLSGF